MDTLMASDGDYVEAITSAYTAIGEIGKQYKHQLRYLPDLPDEFDKVNGCLALVVDAMEHTAKYLPRDESSIAAINPLAAELEKNAKMLEVAFSKFGEDVGGNAGKKSSLDCYYTVMADLGNSHRVEVVMLQLLKTLQSFFTNGLLKEADYIKNDELKNAIESISKVESSLDPNAKNSGTANNQYIAARGLGHQYNGNGQRIITNTYYGKVTKSVFSYDSDEDTLGNKRRVNDTSNRAVSNNQLQQHQQGQAQSVSPNTVNESGVAQRDRPRGREDFRVAIICALPLEYDVVELLFDQFWDEDESYGRARGDTNTYTTGRMGKYDIVLILLPNMGTVAAAGAAASFRSSYPNLELAFLVGICGGMPGKGENEIHLGDVVISKSAVQYDLGKQYHKRFVTRDTVDDSLGRPNKNIRTLVKTFETQRLRERLRRNACLYLKDIQKAAAQTRRPSNYQYPGIDKDKLFVATYQHKHRGPKPCNFCDNQKNDVCEEAAQASCATLGCDESQLVRRTDLEMRGSLGEPEIFVGRIASGNMVMKSGEHRDKIACEQNVIALEMEGAGVWDEIPCIIVKGVCDYADSHKNDLWQRYAAATAASVMKAVLERYTMSDR